MKPSSFNSILEKYNKIYSKEFPYTTKFDTVLSDFLLEQEASQVPAPTPSGPPQQSLEPNLAPTPPSPSPDSSSSANKKTELPKEDLITNVKLIKISVACLYTDIDSILEKYPEARKMRNRLQMLNPNSSSDNAEILKLIYALIRKSNPPKNIKDEEEFTTDEIKDYGSVALLNLAYKAILTPKKDLDTTVSDMIADVTTDYKKIETLLQSGAADLMEIEKMSEDITNKIQEIVSQTELTDASL
jgi:hypothetical protein